MVLPTLITGTIAGSDARGGAGGSRAMGILADVSPNSTGLPGISTLSNIVGALLTIGLIACVA